MATTNDLLYLPSLSQMKLLGGSKGLDHTVTWPYVILCPPISEWVSGGEFLIYYGANMEVEKVELQQLVREAAENDCAGILFLVGEHYVLEKNLDKDLTNLADELALPVFSITSRSYVNSITKDIIRLIQNQDKKLLDASAFWYSLFFEYTDTSQLSTLNKALFLGYMPNYTYCVYILQFMNTDEYFHHLESMHDSRFLESRGDFYHMLASKIHYLIRKEMDIGWHVGQNSSSICVFPVNTPSQEAAIDRYMQNLCIRLETQYPGTRFLTGKGQKGSKLSEIQRSFIHAKRCLLSTSLIPLNGKIISYPELGFYQLLYEIPNAEYPKQYASSILEPLLSYDKENTSMLFETLCAYLKCGCNKVKTAKELYLHRNTLLGRLEKIEKILDISLEDTDVLFHLQAAIKIHRFFTET
jgi:hypothetical protein